MESPEINTYIHGQLTLKMDTNQLNEEKISTNVLLEQNNPVENKLGSYINNGKKLTKDRS